MILGCIRRYRVMFMSHLDKCRAKNQQSGVLFVIQRYIYLVSSLHNQS